MLYIFGDSHACASFKNLQVPHENMYQNSITMFRIGRDNTIINYNLDMDITRNTILLCYGEVDCRCHIGKQVNLGRNEDTVINELVSDYFKTITNNILLITGVQAYVMTRTTDIKGSLTLPVITPHWVEINFVGTSLVHHSMQVISGIKEAKKFPIDVIILGDTKNPPNLPDGPTRPKSNDSRVLQPFFEITKDYLIKEAITLGIQDLIHITGTCGRGSNPACQECWQCQEKTWALKQNNLVPPTGIEPIFAG